MPGNADYSAFFGFKELPFGVSPDRRFLYLGRSSSPVCAQISEALGRREGIVVVVGAAGTGKSAVCRAVIEDILKPQYLSVVVDPLLSVDDLLRQILHDFRSTANGLSADGAVTPHDLVVRLDRFLTALGRDQLAVLLVDDAHHLSADILAMLRVLSNLEDERGKKLQIVLVGQPSLDAQLAQPDVHQLTQRIARRCRIAPMSGAEVERYIAYRLGMGRSGETGSAAGDGADAKRLEVSEETLAPFSAAAVRTLGILGGGLPRAINVVADRALLLASRERIPLITPRVIRSAAASLALRIPLRAWLPRHSAAGALAALALVGAVASPRYVPYRSVFSAVTPTFRSASAVRSVTAPPGRAAGARTAGSAGVSPGQDVLPRGEAYLLVVASFRLQQSAERFAKTLAEQDLPAFVHTDPATQWFAVEVGPYASVDEVNEIKALLAKQQNLVDTHVKVETP
jgi:type II secretory pathway predicted ATPase ExeA